MQIQYGSYTHGQNEATCVITRNAVRGESGVNKETLERWEISGRLHADDAAGITTAIQALENAYALNHLDLKLLLDDGTESAHKILLANTVDGIWVVQPPSYPVGEGYQYGTFRDYHIAVEATLFAAGESELAWSQTINYQGNGGPRWTYKVPLQGDPQPQMLTQRSLVLVTQTGTARGYNAYPIPPAPIYPAQLINEGASITYDEPSLFSRERVTHWNYPMLLPYYPS